MSFAFIPKSLHSDIEDLAIHSMVACAYKSKGVENNKKAAHTNHWVFFLLLGDGTSIRLDPSPNYSDDNKLQLIVSRKPYNYTNQAIKVMQLATYPGLRVGQVLDYIKAQDLIKYKFTSNGQGCRYWVKNIVHNLAITTWIIQGHQELQDALEYVWESQDKIASSSKQSGIIKGDFYAIRRAQQAAQASSSSG